MGPFCSKVVDADLPKFVELNVTLDGSIEPCVLWDLNTNEGTVQIRCLTKHIEGKIVLKTFFLFPDVFFFFLDGVCLFLDLFSSRTLLTLFLCSKNGSFSRREPKKFQLAKIFSSQQHLSDDLSFVCLF